MKLITLIGLAAACLSDAVAHEQIIFQSSYDAKVKPLKVAIIGAGAGGSSTAYHLANYARNASIPVSITVFDRNPYVGGRSTTVSAYNDSSFPVELGASIFVEVNKILFDAVKEFNLSTDALRPQADIPGDRLAVWDGEKIVITQNGGYWDYAKLFWRYGTAPIRTMNLMKKTVNKFLAMYDAPIFPFQSLTKAAQDVGLLAVTASTGDQYMRENGITGQFGREIVQASTRVNYAQNLEYIHGLEAMVCMAAEGAMAIAGGNWNIFDQFLKHAEAAVKLDTHVEGISAQPEGGYTLDYRQSTSPASSSGQFDTVVLAAPYQFSKLKSLGSDKEGREPDKIPYVELHVTLFTSPHLLSPTFFNLAPGRSAPQVVLTTLPDGEPAKGGPPGAGSPGFFSISLLRPITNPHTSAQEYLYKIFSPNAATSEFISHLLGANAISDRDVTWIYRKVWNSYPYEYPRVTFEDVKLGKDLWYTSGMDSFISTMETNALMGKNVARLMVNEWLAQKGNQGQSNESFHNKI